MFTIFWIVIVSFMVGCAAAFLLLLAYKLGIVEWLQVHGDVVVSKMAHCDLCMSWWLSVVITILLVVIMDNVALLCVPFVSTPIARRLL